MLSTLFYDPIYNLVVFILNYISDFGLVIIITAVLVKIVLFPIHNIQINNQLAMQNAKPDLDKLKEKQKQKNLTAEEKQALGMEMLAIYKKHNIKFSAMFLPLFVQFPYLIAMYFVFYKGGFPTIITEKLYSFVSTPTEVAMQFLGSIDMNETNILLAILAGATQFLALHISMPEVKFADFKKRSPDLKTNFAESMKVNLKFGLPVFIVVILSTSLSSSIALYWIAINLMTALQEFIVRGKKQQIKNNIEKKKKD